ncbi:MAG: YdcF family protein [Opitutales bacterium]|nr:YdcF family protein [Opitutales bacterium]
MRTLLHSPLSWLLFASFLLWLWTTWRTFCVSGETAGNEARPKATTPPTATRVQISALALAAFLTLWLFVFAISTPLGSDTLRRTLTTHWRVPTDFSPDYILVAAMGYVPSGDHGADVLRAGTAARIAEAARWWEKHPHAALVMQGSSGRPELGEDHQGRLMKRFATAYGVPAEQILLESHSRNTREHVKYFLESEGITTATPIGVVTSDWHMRRTAREFQKSFENVHFRATYSPVVRGLSARNCLPHEEHLHNSALYIREWIASFYYRFRRP